MVPNYLSQVQQARDRYPEAWRSAHVHGDPTQRVFAAGWLRRLMEFV